jgi:transcriptional regulator with XRE-family HTH domain
MKKTNFDRYLDKQLQDPEFAARFEEMGEAWEVSLQLAALRQKAGLSQKELARRLKTSQQQISRLESPGYEGHSLANLRRVAGALKARVRVVFEPEEPAQLKAVKRLDTIPSERRATSRRS